MNSVSDRHVVLILLWASIVVWWVCTYVVAVPVPQEFNCSCDCGYHVESKGETRIVNYDMADILPKCVK
jgi:hypothetical protein